MDHMHFEDGSRCDHIDMMRPSVGRSALKMAKAQCAKDGEIE
jgi:hypothetical protein